MCNLLFWKPFFVNPVVTHQHSLALVFCFLRQLNFSLQGSLFAFNSARSTAELNLLSITTPCWQTAQMFLHFVLTLYASSYWRDEGSSRSRRPRLLVFPTLFWLAAPLSIDLAYPYLLSYMAGEFVSHLRCLLIGSLIPFFPSFVECVIFDDCDLLQGCFTQANNYVGWREHRESYSSTLSPLVPKSVHTAHYPWQSD